MVHAKKIEEKKLKKIGREWNRTMAKDGNSSMARLEVQGKPRFKKSFPNEIPSTTPRINKAKGSTPKPQEGKGSRPYIEKLTCAINGRKHEQKCLVGMGKCYNCGKSGHMKRDFPMMIFQGR